MTVEESQRKGKAGANKDGDSNKVATGLEEIRDMVRDLSAGIPIGGTSSDDVEEQVNELKRAMPSEIARVTNKIVSLEKELAQLQDCKHDITESLF